MLIIAVRPASPPEEVSLWLRRGSLSATAISSKSEWPRIRGQNVAFSPQKASKSRKTISGYPSRVVPLDISKIEAICEARLLFQACPALLGKLRRTNSFDGVFVVLCELCGDRRGRGVLLHEFQSYGKQYGSFAEIRGTRLTSRTTPDSARLPL